MQLNMKSTGVGGIILFGLAIGAYWLWHAGSGESLTSKGKQQLWVQQVKAKLLGQPFPVLKDRPALSGPILIWELTGRSDANNDLPAAQMVGQDSKGPMTILFVVRDAQLSQTAGRFKDSKFVAEQTTWHVWIASGVPFQPVGYLVLQVDPPPAIQANERQASPHLQGQVVLPTNVARWAAGGTGKVLSAELGDNARQLEEFDQQQRELEFTRFLLREGYQPLHEEKEPGVGRVQVWMLIDKGRMVRVPIGRPVTEQLVRSVCQEAGIVPPEFKLATDSGRMSGSE